MNWNQALFPSLQRRGGCAIKEMSRSNLSSRRRGGAKRKPDRAQPQEKIGEIFRPEEFTELTTPSAALRRLRAFLLMPQPPLLFKEGNVSALKQSVNSFTRSDALGQNSGNRLINMLTTIFTFTLLLAHHAFTPDEIAEGGRLYQSYCASCHGSAGDQLAGSA